MEEKLKRAMDKLAKFLSAQRSNVGLAVLALGLGGFLAAGLLHRHMIPLLGVDLQQFEQLMISQYNDYDWAKLTTIMSVSFWLLLLAPAFIRSRRRRIKVYAGELLTVLEVVGFGYTLMIPHSLTTLFALLTWLCCAYFLWAGMDTVRRLIRC